VELCCVGLNFRTAALSVRERFAVPGDTLISTHQSLLEDSPISEVMILSTCNRVEAYALTRTGYTVNDVISHLESTLFVERGMSRSDLKKHCYRSSGAGALGHLFRVASSLDSMVLGEPQILGQVKNAWEVAREAGTGGKRLQRIMDRAFRAGKKIRTDTELAKGAVSVSFVAVELARRIFPDLKKCTVVVLGAGEMAELTATHLSEHGAQRVVIANRSEERAKELAEKHQWDAASLTDIPLLLSQADIVIASTGSPNHVVTVPQVKNALSQRHFRPLFLVDIAVPRDVESEVGEMDGVYLYNVDDLETLADRNRESRANEVKLAEELIKTEVDSFQKWVAAQSVTPTIASFRQKLMEIRDLELSRSDAELEGLSPEQRKAVERLTQSMVTRFLHDPIAQLKTHAGKKSGEKMAAVIRELFGLADITLVQEEGDGDVAEEEKVKSGESEDAPERKEATGNES